MAFPEAEVERLLAACHRRCCVCHRFCGVKLELDHIQPRAAGGDDSIENAIPVCFECHAEIHSYNDQHPRGRKFRPRELRRHKEQWLEIVKSRPEVFVEPSRDADVGPLQALIDELEFNAQVAKHPTLEEIGSPFMEDQFLRAIRQGSIAILREPLKTKLLEAYRLMRRANTSIRTVATPDPIREEGNTAVRRLKEAAAALKEAHDQLLSFLGPTEDSG